MLVSALKSGEILREFGEILGKFRILGGRSVESKGLIALNLKKKTDS